MHIYPKNTGPIRPETTRTSAPADLQDRAQVSPIAPAPSGTDRSDKVEISDAGRALAARGTSDASSTSSLDPARVGRIRGRILSGAYDTLEVVDAMARRIMDSGDL